MEKEEVLNKARSDHSRQEPRRQLLERNAGYLSFIALSAIGIIWKLAEWFIDQTLGTASINGLSFPLSDFLFGFLSLGMAVTEISLLIQTRQIRYLALALFFLLLPAIMSWRIFCG